METKEARKRTLAGDALTELVLETFRFNGLLMEASDQRIKHLGITSTLWKVLSALSDAPMPMAKVARNMGLTRQSVRRSVNRLKDKGLVDCSENPDHQRAKLISITANGAILLDEINEIQIEWSNDVASRLEVDKLNLTTETMKAIEQILHNN
ncbi:MAG TPA: MarR family transcriptional regulator [Solidesulfovibrio magneticus]|nr:MarR family transcriptional regulator [Solidesulfovibrio magneticus]